jgi:hypothetical protein
MDECEVYMFPYESTFGDAATLEEATDAIHYFAVCGVSQNPAFQSEVADSECVVAGQEGTDVGQVS